MLGNRLNSGATKRGSQPRRYNKENTTKCQHDKHCFKKITVKVCRNSEEPTEWLNQTSDIKTKLPEKKKYKWLIKVMGIWESGVTVLLFSISFPYQDYTFLMSLFQVGSCGLL